MRKVKLFLAAFTAATMLLGNTSAAIVSADDDIKPVSVDIVGSKKTVYAGSTFELRAKTTPSDADDDALYWTVVGNKNIVRLEKDRSDDELEVKALKEGTTKIRCHIKGTSKKDYITITVKKKKTNGDISKSGSLTRTVEAGDDFELKVKKPSGLNDKYLKWSIKDTKILGFDDNDITDDEVELYAKKPGTTTVSCRNSKTKTTITYTIKVIPDRDDDRYDDDDFFEDDYDDDDHD